MRFGIWSNGFRPHTVAERTYEEDLREIVLAEELGFEDAWISEHHPEPLYEGAVDVLPLPELLMCKAAALTSRIRFGAAVKVINLTHPVDIALQAATADHVIGGGRYIFGFGSGFPNRQFTDERGLGYDDRHERTLESLELILRCWRETEPFDWEGRFWSGTDIVVLPKPLQQPHMPIATATLTPDSVAMAGARGYMLLSAGAPAQIRRLADIYALAASGAGLERPLENIVVSASIYVSDSPEQAVAELREGAEYEMTFQRERGLLKMLAGAIGAGDTVTFDELVEHGQFIVGDPDTVAGRLEQLWEESGGFGTLLYRCGKSWAPPDRIHESMRRFAAEVVPRLAPLTAERVPDERSIAR
jgi:limonene 1,2-monooxygenase